MSQVRRILRVRAAMGFCAVAWSDAGVVRFQLPTKSAEAAERLMRRRAVGAEPAAPPEDVAAVVATAKRYFAGEETDFSLVRLDLGGEEAFFTQIYVALRRVGWGCTTTYGALAKEVGAGREAARDVGQAMARNPAPLIIPCHRVLGAGGKNRRFLGAWRLADEDPYARIGGRSRSTAGSSPAIFQLLSGTAQGGGIRGGLAQIAIRPMFRPGPRLNFAIPEHILAANGYDGREARRGDVAASRFPLILEWNGSLMPTIALVDDDRNILTSVSLSLEAEGYRVQTYTDGASALEGLKSNPPDLAIFDIKMPRMDGMELLRRLRQKSDLPVIFLTSKDEEIDELFGLKMGADDFIRKPFSQRLLVERVKAILRRSNPKDAAAQKESEAKILERGRLKMDPERHTCTWDNAPVTLTVTEFLILQALATRPGVVKSRNALMDAAYDDQVYVDDRTIDSHIKRLRKKFKVVEPEFEMIETLYGVGYRFKEG